jgi:hypothetical protein
MSSVHFLVQNLNWSLVVLDSSCLIVTSNPQIKLKGNYAASLTYCSAASVVQNLAYSLIATGESVDFHGTASEEVEIGVAA